MNIRGGTLITRDGPVEGDITVADGRISAVEPRKPLSDGDVDATGLWVLPGGVDPHTHFGMPLSGGISSLGWRNSSTAALLGGTTTVVDFANPAVGEPLGAAVQRWRDMADGTILCDYGLHVTVTDTSPERLAEIPGLVSVGLPTFKGFLAYKGRLMLSAAHMKTLMAAVREAGGLLLVHAEDGEMNAVAEKVLLDLGRIGPSYHPDAHPAESEEKAVAEVLALAAETGCPLEIVHISLARSAELLNTARAAGHASLVGEVCLHHLMADDSLYQAGHEAALGAICSPPLRPRENGDGLWDMLADGRLDMLATDHCEFPLAVKARAAGGGFPAVPNGCGGVGERLVLSYTQGVATGRMTPARWIDTLATRPAELMGLGDRKGALTPGFDADIVLFDPEPSYRWEPLGPSDRAGSIWAGLPARGVVKDVWLRGTRVVQGGRLVSNTPGGCFLPRLLNSRKD